MLPDATRGTICAAQNVSHQPPSASNTGLWLLTHLDKSGRRQFVLSSCSQELLLCSAVQHRGLTWTVAVTVSLAMTYPMSSTSPTEHSVLGTTPRPERGRLMLVFATWMSRVSKNCPEGAWVSPSAQRPLTPPADPSQGTIPELRQDPKVGTGNFVSPLSTALVSFTHPFILTWTKRDDEGFIFTWLKRSNCSDQQEGAIGIQN